MPNKDRNPPHNSKSRFLTLSGRLNDGEHLWFGPSSTSKRWGPMALASEFSLLGKVARFSSTTEEASI